MRLGRILAVLVGLVLVAVGLLTMVTTIAGLALVGFDDILDTGEMRFESPTSAIAADTGGLGQDAVRDRAWGDDDPGRLRLAATSEDSLFVGVGPTDDVRAYLDQAPWDEVDDVLAVGRFSTSEPDVDYSRRGADGSPADLPAPGDESFWTASDSGTSVELDWDFADGDHTVVLMNAAGQGGITADGSLEVEIPRLTVALVLGAVVGLVLLLLGLVFLLVVGRHRRRR